MAFFNFWLSGGGDNFRPGISKSVAAELQISSEIIIFRVSQIVPIPPKKESSLTPKLRQATDTFTFSPPPPPHVNEPRVELFVWRLFLEEFE